MMKRLTNFSLILSGLSVGLMVLFSFSNFISFFTSRIDSIFFFDEFLYEYMHIKLYIIFFLGTIFALIIIPLPYSIFNKSYKDFRSIRYYGSSIGAIFISIAFQYISFFIVLNVGSYAILPDIIFSIFGFILSFNIAFFASDMMEEEKENDA